MLVVDFAHQIIEMDNRIRALEFQNERLREIEIKYYSLLDDTVDQSAENLLNLFQLGMSLASEADQKKQG